MTLDGSLQVAVWPEHGCRGQGAGSEGLEVRGSLTLQGGVTRRAAGVTEGA